MTWLIDAGGWSVVGTSLRVGAPLTADPATPRLSPGPRAVSYLVRRTETQIWRK